jgi:5'-3' exonuclease
MEFNFELGKPFKPFEQLMGVLPEASSSHIPVAFRVRTLFRCLPLCWDRVSSPRVRL